MFKQFFMCGIAYIEWFKSCFLSSALMNVFKLLFPSRHVIFNLNHFPGFRHSSDVYNVWKPPFTISFWSELFSEARTHLIFMNAILFHLQPRRNKNKDKSMILTFIFVLLRKVLLCWWCRRSPTCVKYLWATQKAQRNNSHQKLRITTSY